MTDFPQMKTSTTFHPNAFSNGFNGTSKGIQVLTPDESELKPEEAPPIPPSTFAWSILSVPRAFWEFTTDLARLPLLPGDGTSGKLVYAVETNNRAKPLAMFALICTTAAVLFAYAIRRTG